MPLLLLLITTLNHHHQIFRGDGIIFIQKSGAVVKVNRYTFLFVLLIGCNNSALLSIKPQLSYTPNLNNVGALTYTIPSSSTDLFLDKSNVIEVHGFVGDFKLMIESTQDINNVGVVVSVNDASLISNIFFARIYHELFWGGSLFNIPLPAQLPNGRYLDDKLQGTYAIFDGDNLAEGSSISFDSIVFGLEGLEIHFQVFAMANGSYINSNNEHETTIIFME